jgi:ketosteroid isomerase-like protein
MSAKELIRAYYASLRQHDDRWQGMYSDDAVFADASHALNAVGKAAVIQSFIPFLKSVSDVKLSRLIVDEERACAIVDYVYVNPKGERLSQSVAEVWQVRNDKFTELIIYFDLTAYRSFMRG